MSAFGILVFARLFVFRKFWASLEIAWRRAGALPPHTLGISPAFPLPLPLEVNVYQGHGDASR
jgi:hypothetical protein